MFHKNFLRGVPALFAILALTLGWAMPSASAAPAAQADPVSIVQEYYAAYNAGDLDKAVGYLADDVTFVNPTGTFVGKAKARENLEAIKKDGLTFELSDFKDDNGRVTYAYNVIIGGDKVETGTDGLTIVRDSKIVFDGTVATEQQLPTTGAALPNTPMWVALAGLLLVVVGAGIVMRRLRDE